MKPLHIALWAGGAAVVGYILYRMFWATPTAAPLTVSPDGTSSQPSSSPSSSGAGNGRQVRRKTRRGGDDYAPSASDFVSSQATKMKEADSVIEGDDDEMSDGEDE